MSQALRLPAALVKTFFSLAKLFRSCHGASMSKPFARKTRPKTKGAMALRRFIKKGGEPLIELRKLVGQSNLNKHAGTKAKPPECAPATRFALVYEAKCGIKPVDWLTADERRRSGLDAAEPCVEHCGGAE
jgi:hypothetical protein